ncbi:MAG: segregation/condensation protein A [Lachnospiraceae bacterium]|nr:segregation/condensation protein A [Lachnospiraceae bacterium]
MLSVKLETFEGPLDLLLHLIDRNKVSIYDIPIIEITAQYMEYVNAMDKKDLDLVSDFLVMAATLLDIKSRMLLPAEVDEEGEEVDPREELVARLTEYKLYKSLAHELAEYQDGAERQLYKAPTIPKEVSCYEEPVDVAKLLSGITLQKLQDIYRMVMKRQVDKLDPIRSRFGNIQKEPVRLSEKLAYVFDYAQMHSRFSFAQLLLEQKSKADVIVTFLACLELIKIGRLDVKQEGTFADIDFVWNENCETQITKEDMEQYD